MDGWIWFDWLIWLISYTCKIYLINYFFRLVNMLIVDKRQEDSTVFCVSYICLNTLSTSFPRQTNKQNKWFFNAKGLLTYYLIKHTGKHLPANQIKICSRGSFWFFFFTYSPAMLFVPPLPAFFFQSPTLLVFVLLCAWNKCLLLVSVHL